MLQLARGIEPLASTRARDLLGRFTTNRFAGLATGAVATTILDSSSVTIILVIALVNGGLRTFQQSLGVIMGANIGTTVSSQIFASDVEANAPLVLFAGFLPRADRSRHARRGTEGRSGRDASARAGSRGRSSSRRRGQPELSPHSAMRRLRRRVRPSNQQCLAD
ncbi:MAG: Na/Pi symporter [Acidobacteria bacterium]|nr:Na/Pi symporter [Acidobacteriota bacterium]